MKHLRKFENFDLIKEDNLDLKSIGKKLYSLLKSKGYVVKLNTETWSYMGTLFTPRKFRSKKSSEKDSYHLDSDTGSITNTSDLLRKEIVSDNPREIKVRKTFKNTSNLPYVIISESGPDEKFYLLISIISFYENVDDMFGKREVVDKEKNRELSKIISDFLSTFSTIEVENRISTFDKEIHGFFVRSKEQ